MYLAYILKSLKDGTYYYGSTSDIKKRLQYHNTGKSKYTKSKRPWTIYYTESFNSKSEAIQREMFFKSINGYIWLRSNKVIT